MRPALNFIVIAALLGAAGCGAVKLRLPAEYRDKKLVGDPPPDYMPGAPEHGTPLNPAAPAAQP